ncbi:MAG: hypothetical protein HS116_06430 [Planctomycetes bacterium]|nr:hypothetical protein [Planctomycetota bacterium]
MDGLPEGHDKNIWRLAKAIEKAVYCPRNPVERKLVRLPEAWRWSSFRWLNWVKMSKSRWRWTIGTSGFVMIRTVRHWLLTPAASGTSS